MKITLKKKILAVILLLTFLAIIVTSVAYFSFFIRDVRKLSRQQIRIARLELANS